MFMPSSRPKGGIHGLAAPESRRRMHAYIAEVSRHLECPVIEVGGVEDHVHILARLGKTVSVSVWIKEVKRVSSIFGKEFHGDFAWQAGYAAFSVDSTNLNKIANYVRNQEEHHHTVSFQDELRAVLTEHGVEWNEQYLWD
jgi:putative transposase